jgi:hypothetical protein
MTSPYNRKCLIYWAFQLHWAQLAVAIQFNSIQLGTKSTGAYA